MNKKELRVATTGKYVDPPTPSKLFIPEWYKESEQFIGGKVQVVATGINRGPKLCVPFLDAMTAGYTATLWQDIVVSRENDEQVIRWEIAPNSPEPAQDRASNTYPSFPIPAGHSSKHFIWKSPYIFETPPGYSLLLTHPINRFDLPFTTLSGIVDADGTMSSGNIPFYIKEDFEGVIEQGTPIFQVIPFKRDNWKAVLDLSLIEKSIKNLSLTGRRARGWYKNNLWRKKTYE
jgi:hypothetical protein